MNDLSAARQRLAETPFNVLRRLPLIGRLMVVVRDAAVTHERIGEVERVDVQGDKVFCVGAAHDCAIDLRRIAGVVIDRSGRMKERVLPKLEFVAADDTVMFSVVGLDDIDRFEAAMRGFNGAAVEPRVADAGEAATLGPDDAAARPLKAALAAGATVAVSMRGPGILQNWRGLLGEINPAMGFINIITPDFHLHVRGSAVSGWQRQAAGDALELTALDRDGARLGLSLRGPARAFGDA